MKDSAGNTYREVEMEAEHVRLTYVAQGWNDTPSVRFQIRDEDGHLRQGPEIPLKIMGSVVGALLDLVTEQTI